VEKLMRRSILLAAAVALSAATAAQGQTDYPSKPIRFLIPFAPGGTADVLARVMGQRLQSAWGAQALNEPRPGAGGMIATEVAARAAPDGYTYIIVTVGHAVNPSLYPKMAYDALADFAPAGMIALSPSVLTVHPSVPAKSVKELIALARARPGQINYGTGGNATTAHVSVAMFAAMAGVELTHVPYKGAPLAVQDLVGGRLEMMIDQIASSLGFIRADRLRAIAVSPAKRTPQLPDVPTIAESGLPGYDFTAWWLFLAPAATPPEIVARFNRELSRASGEPAFREQLARFGMDPAPGQTPAELTEFLRSEVKRWATVVKQANIRAQ